MNRTQSQELKEVLQAIDLKIVANELFPTKDVHEALKAIVVNCQTILKRLP